MLFTRRCRARLPATSPGLGEAARHLAWLILGAGGRILKNDVRVKVSRSAGRIPGPPGAALLVRGHPTVTIEGNASEQPAVSRDDDDASGRPTAPGGGQAPSGDSK